MKFKKKNPLIITFYIIFMLCFPNYFFRVKRSLKQTFHDLFFNEQSSIENNKIWKDPIFFDGRKQENLFF